MKLLTLPGVFRPRSDSWLLADTIRDQGLADGARVLDVFTGSGVLALTAARHGADSVTAVDVLRRAVATVWLNARLNGLRLKALCGDLFRPVSGRQFDLIVANPPYVPDEHDPASPAARAWSAGPDGRALLNRFCAEAPRHLAPGGRIALVQSSVSSTPLTLAALGEHGLDAQVVEKRRGPLGPLMCASRPDLDSEELHVIVARSSW
jgi:release factor glutamine methyltransferase